MGVAHKLLTQLEEIELGKQLNKGKALIKEAQLTLAGYAELGYTSPTLMEAIDRKIEQGKRVFLRARNTLAEHNLRLVGSIAGSMYKDDIVFDHESRFSVGLEGLMSACNKFDVTRTKEDGSPCRFSTYATYWIRQAITRGRQSDAAIRIPYGKHEKYSKWLKLLETESDPTPEQKAEVWGANPDGTLAKFVNVKFPYSLNYQTGKDRDIEFIEIADDECLMLETQEEQIDNIALTQVMEAAKTCLTPGEYQAINLLFCTRQANGRPHTLSTAGVAMNISRQRVQQMKRNGLDKLKGLFREPEPVTADCA